MRAARCFLLLCLAFLILPAAGWPQEEEEYAGGAGGGGTEESAFKLSGYFQAQYGLFTDAQYNRKSDDQGFPKDHGDLAGKPSMLRNTLLLEANWKAAESVRVHAIFRAVRSGALRADRYAQDPLITADTKYNNNEDVQQQKIDYVRDRYYTEAKLREIYIDADAGSRLNFRIGKQQVSWGDMATFRLLDPVCAVDGTWHLPPFESFEDTRVPLYMAKTIFDVPELKGYFETLFVPLIDDPQDTANVPATFYGAWGLPLPPKNEYVSDLRVAKKVIQYPKNDFSDSRVGIRWKGQAGSLTYSLVAYHGHMLSPPIPDFVVKNGAPDADGFYPATVYLKIPRQNTYGFTLNYTFGAPVNAVLKLEAALQPDTIYPANSLLTAGYWPDEQNPRTWKAVDPNAAPGQSALRAPFYSETRHQLSYGLEFFRLNQFNFINRNNQIISVLRVLQNFYFNPKDINDGKYKLGEPYIDETLPDGTTVKRKDWYIVSIPGYDTTIANPMTTTLVFSTFTSFFHGSFTPGITAVFVPRYKSVIKGSGEVFDSDAFNKGSGFISATLKFAMGNHWRLETGYNYLYGDDPYYDLGLFRDRDEVYGKVRLQF
jgi:hypothetical protein